MITPSKSLGTKLCAADDHQSARRVPRRASGQAHQCSRPRVFAGRIVQGVEKYLGEVLHLGVRASVTIDKQQDWEEQWLFERELVYGRYGEKFRIFVTEANWCAGDLDDLKETLWANCPRDVKLMAFNGLPELLYEMVRSLESTLE
jgi:hypothetical protein